ncbi:glycosyltransferase family 2 protein [Geminisphaera colitermitum]|uniref:glycosyltransferase family 2 protein n=1 Tax=Geminisphaera colitermitum TaxID=1148786 RepID=UPI000158D266|nr:glycosyltransferase family 2 protein [Geminisphaera colitermitum]
MNPRLSVILPVFNRVPLLRHPLDSLRSMQEASADRLSWEVIVVDDGSVEDVSGILTAYSGLPIHLHRLQKNSGLLRARLEGLALAGGEAVMFLDADDAIAPGKFEAMLDALADADVVHGDMARRAIDCDGRASGPLRFDPPSAPVHSPAEFYLRLQPAPHNPIFRRDYLQAAIASPVCPPDRNYDSIAETWFYYHLALRPARIACRPGAWSIVGEPDGERLSRKWERQYAASVRLMEAFLAGLPVNEDTLEARRQIGLAAFAAWRALPHGFPSSDRLLAIWRRCPPVSLARLGGSTFARAARLLGPVLAGRLFRRLQRPPYARIRTVTPDELKGLFA